MIISYKRKYLFIEIPHTASTAISQELCKHYDGHPILSKHTPYYVFKKNATDDEKSFFTFCGSRNPMDMAVTRYFKRKTNHQGFFTNPKHWRKYGGHVSNKALREYKFIQKRKAPFNEYFKKFYRIPYDSWGCPNVRDFDFIIRYENLQEDFATLLNKLGIEQVRPLPEVNITKGKSKDYIDYYIPAIHSRAVWVFGSYMRAWGYSFPDAWGYTSIPWFSHVLFRLKNKLIRIFFKILL